MIRTANRTPSQRRRGPLLGLGTMLLALCILLARQALAPRVQGQTVPRTPPPTWTPARPPDTATPRPTRPAPPTVPPATPAPEPPPTEAPPVAGETQPPPADDPPIEGAPTEAEPTDEAVLQGPSGLAWLWLDGEPLVVGPGSAVTLTLELHSVGAEPLEGVAVTLPADPRLALTAARPLQGDVGDAAVSAEGLVWTPPALAPGDALLLEITGHVAADVLPDGVITLQALAVEEGRGGEPLTTSLPLELVLPWAPLPEAGIP